MNVFFLPVSAARHHFVVLNFLSTTPAFFCSLVLCLLLTQCISNVVCSGGTSQVVTSVKTLYIRQKPPRGVIKPMGVLGKPHPRCSEGLVT